MFFTIPPQYNDIQMKQYLLEFCFLNPAEVCDLFCTASDSHHRNHKTWKLKLQCRHRYFLALLPRAQVRGVLIFKPLSFQKRYLLALRRVNVLFWFPPPLPPPSCPSSLSKAVGSGEALVPIFCFVAYHNTVLGESVLNHGGVVKNRTFAV